MFIFNNFSTCFGLPPSPYDRSGIYKLTCMTCNKAYVGQTSRNLRQRYKVHARYIKNNNPKLTVASCWFSVSLHNLLTMHGHRNLKLTDISFRECCKNG